MPHLLRGVEIFFPLTDLAFTPPLVIMKGGYPRPPRHLAVKEDIDGSLHFSTGRGRLLWLRSGVPEASEMRICLLLNIFTFNKVHCCLAALNEKKMHRSTTSAILAGLL